MENALINLELQEVENKEYEGFVVDDINKANWCFRKIRALKEKIEEVERLAEAERMRIDTWEQKETKSSKEAIEYFEGLLTEYFKHLKAKDSKARVSTPYGKITSRKAKKWNYTDEGTLLNYLKQNDTSLVRIKESINKAELKKKYKDGLNAETGEILPGVEITSEESISIKVE